MNIIFKFNRFALSCAHYLENFVKYGIPLLYFIGTPSDFYSLQFYSYFRSFIKSSENTAENGKHLIPSTALVLPFSFFSGRETGSHVARLVSSSLFNKR